MVAISCGSRHTLALTSPQPQPQPQPLQPQPRPPQSQPRPSSPYESAIYLDVGGGGAADGGGDAAGGGDAGDGVDSGGGGEEGGGGGGGGGRRSVQLFTWGWGVYAQLGHGDLTSRLAPCAVEAVGAALATCERAMVACGYRHSMLCCEHAAPPHGQYGSRSAPELARGPREGARGAEAAPRLVTSVWAWGWGRHGQLGLGGWADALTPQLLPARAFGGRRILQLCLGGRHSLAITVEGAVFAFGRDDDGQLGLGAAGQP